MERAKQKLSAVALWKKVLAVFLSLLLFGMSFPTTSLQGLARAYGEGQDTLIVTDDKNVDSAGDESPEPNKGGDNEKDAVAPADTRSDDKAEDTKADESDAKADDKADKADKSDGKADEKVAAAETKVNADTDSYSPQTEALNKKILEALRDNYAKEGITYDAATIEVLEGPLQDGEEVETIKAGEIVRYNLKYSFYGPMYWDGSDYDTPLPIFDWYENSVVKLRLPKELVPMPPASGETNFLNFVKAEDQKDTPEGFVDYECELDKSIPAKSMSKLQSLNIRAIGSGTDDAVYQISNDMLEDALTIETSFKAINKQDPNNPIIITENGKPVSEENPAAMTTDSSTSKETMIGFTTKTDDEWGVAKSLYGDIAVDSYNMTATVQYMVEVGFERPNNQVERSVDQYSGSAAGLGRDAVSILLHDVLEASVAEVSDVPSVHNNEITAQRLSTDRKSVIGDPVTYSVTNTTVEKEDKSVVPIDVVDIPLTADLGMETVKTQVTGDNNYAPSYTPYLITVTYDLTEGMIPSLDEASKKFHSENTATIAATLAAKSPLKPAVQYDEASDEGDADIDPRGPVAVNIAKVLRTGGGEVYYTANDRYYENEYGVIQYKISASEKFEVFTKDAGGKYKSLGYKTEFTLPNEGTYYVMPGVSYTVEEILSANQNKAIPFHHVHHYTKTGEGGDEADVTTNAATKKLAEGSSPWNVQFYNTEQIGELTVHKLAEFSVGGAENTIPLAGAVFELLGPDKKPVEVTINKGLPTEAKVTQVTTNPEGNARFYDVPFGKYIIHEVSAPHGYGKADDQEIDVALDETHWGATVEVKDVSYRSSINLMKYIVDEKGGTSAAPFKYGGTFTLKQRVVGTNEWKDVESGKDAEGKTIVGKDLNGNSTEGFSVSTSQNKLGTLEEPFSVLAKNPADLNQVYEYCFFEDTVPDGIEGADPSAVVTLLDAQGNAKLETTVVQMNNFKKGKVVVNKEFWNADGTKVTAAGTNTEVTLYSIEGDTVMTVGTEAAGTSGAASWNVPLYKQVVNDQGETTFEKISYYVTETDVTGYQLDATAASKDKDGKAAAKTIDGKTYYPVDYFTTVDGVGTLKKNLYNVQQAAKVTVFKKNSYGDAKLSGAKFTMYDGEKVAKDAAGANVDNVEITEADKTNGKVVYMEAGKSYDVVETVKPAGYPNQDNATSDSPEVADLSNVAAPTVTYKADGTVDKINPANVDVVLYNSPDPTVSVVKKDATDKSKSVDGAKFTVFIKDGNAYKPYPNATNPLVLTSGSGNAVLPAGTYYIGETETPNGYINPNTVPSVYGYNDKTPQTEYNGKKLYLTEVPVKNADKDKGANTFEIEAPANYPNYTKIIVNKKIDGQVSNVGGFEIDVVGTVKKSDNTDKTCYNKQQKIELTGSGASAAAKTEFVDVPIYDNETGNKISYTITENLDASGTLKASYYYVSGNEKDVTLDRDKDGKPVVHEATVNNESLVTISTNKTNYHTWEFPETNQLYYTPGVTIGLYKQAKEGDNWVWQANKQTDANGYVSFEGLTRDGSYALVEMSSNSPYMYAGPDSKVDLSFTDANELSNLTGYNYKMISKADLAASEGADTKKTFNLVDKEAWHGYSNIGLVNHDHWTQFHIIKYKNGTLKDGKLDGERLDGAVFEVYRLELPQGWKGELTFPSDGSGSKASGIKDANGNDVMWTLESSPVSGTALDKDGKAVSGEALSGVDQKITNDVVYMVRELNPGPSGATIDPAYQYQLFISGTAAPVNKVKVVAKNGSAIKEVSGVPYNRDKRTDAEFNNITGTGPGSILLADLRITKWQDTVDENGIYKGVYTPLPNATFELSVLGHDVSDTQSTVKSNHIIENLIVGKDFDPNATSGTSSLSVAQSQLMAFNVAQKTLTYYVGSENGVTLDVDYETVELDNGYVVYRIPVTLTETNAPEGYKFNNNLSMYLCFVTDADGASLPNVTNDAYYVTSATGQELAANQVGTAAYVTSNGNKVYGDNTQYRIVNYPKSSAIVTVEKHGYTPTNDTVGMTSDDLDKTDVDIHSIPMSVKMRLYKLQEDGSYKPWDYSANAVTSTVENAEFTTNAEGRYVFTQGLSLGKYRIVEVNLLNYASNYENAYNSVENGREFTVTPEDMAVSMYNPIKPSLKVVKKDAEGNAANEVTFTLGNIAASKNGNVTTFSNIPSGTYKLTEKNSNGQNPVFSMEYLTNYINSLSDPMKSTLKALMIDGNALIGYEYENKSGDRVVKTIGYNNLGTDATALVVQDPKLVDVTLQKTAENSTTALDGAKFNVSYAKFTDKNGITSWNGSTFKVEDATWTSLGEKTTSDGGKISLTKVDPGIYSFTETAAPAGYDLIKGAEADDGLLSQISGGIPDADKAHDVTFYVVVKGGMDVNVDWGKLGKPVYLLDADGTFDSYKDPTKKPTPTVVEDGQLNITNRPKPGVTATKTVVASKVVPSWTVTLDLYDGDAATETKVGSATLTNENASDVVFMNGKEAVKLSQYKNYYVVENAPANFQINTVEINGKNKTGTEKIHFGKTGYDFTSLDAEQSIAINFQNVYTLGHIVFSKVEDGTTTTLPKGKFQIVQKVVENGVTSYKKVEGSSVVEQTKEESGKTIYLGVYDAYVPLQKTDNPDTAQTFYIEELEAPEGYVTPEETDAARYKEFSLTIKNNENEEELVMTNIAGEDLVITKYADAYVDGASIPLETNGKVNFTLYKRLPGENVWSVAYANQATNSQGQVKWFLDPTREYAVSEYWDPTTYRDADVIRVTDESGITRQLTPESITLKSGETVKNAVVLGQPTGDLQYEAYNKPYIKMLVYKKDVGGYNADARPKAKFAIYDLGTGDVKTEGLTEAEVAEIVGSPNNPNEIYRSATTDQLDTSNYRHFFEWTGEFGGGYDPDHSYLIVETEVSSSEKDIPYDTLNKDNNKVKWYVGVPKNPNASPDETYSVDLDNVYTDAVAKISKKIVSTQADKDNLVNVDADTAEVESLLMKDQTTVVYQIEPEVEGNTQPLSSFKMSDSPLNFVPEAASSTSQYVAPNYTLTAMSLRGASQNVSTVKGCEKVPADTPITATVTWLNAAGDPVGEPTVIENANVQTEFGNNSIYQIPEGAAGFEIEYFSKAVSDATKDAPDATKGRYVLGTDFEPGSVLLTTVVDRQQDGTATNPMQETDSFTNTANVELTYLKWSKNGEIDKTPTKSTDDAKATVNVNSITLPTMNIEKTASEEIVKIDGEGVVEYTITAKNTLDSLKEGGPFQQAYLIDMLPKGVTYVDHEAHIIKAGSTEPSDIDVEMIPVIQSKEIPYGDDSETAVEFKVNDPIGVEDTLVINLKALVNTSAITYGDKMVNFVYLTSSEKMPHTVNNANGYPYKSGSTLRDLDSSAASTQSETAVDREQALKPDLQYEDVDFGNKELGFIHADATVNADGGGFITLNKALKADQDETYHGTGFLGMATRTNPTTGQKGYIDYRLTTVNDINDYPVVQIAIGDVLPGVDTPPGEAVDKNYDGRNSKWSVVMEEIKSIYIGGGEVLDEDGEWNGEYRELKEIDEGSGYTLYYYTGKTSAAAAGINGWLADSANYDSGKAWPVATSLPDGWQLASEVDDLTMVTAFIVVFDKDVKMEIGDSLVVNYRVDTPSVDSEHDNVFATMAFENVTNNFWFSAQRLRQGNWSNWVTATVTDGRVNIAGDVWIDEDWDAEQQKTATLEDFEPNTIRRDYSKYAIVNMLVESLSENSVKITDQVTNKVTYPTKVPQALTYGESILRFQFDNLSAAKARDLDTISAPLYIGVNGDVNPKALKTDKPVTYQITATLGGKNVDKLTQIFKPTNRGDNWYVSDDPDQMLSGDYVPIGTTGIKRGEAGTGYDSNFIGAGTTYNTNIFYVMNSQKMDESKDIGFKMYRNLEITKVAKDSPSVVVPGAEFKIYGPFDEGQGNDAVLRDVDDGQAKKNLIGTYTTGDDGKISVTGLNWWKEYVIVESEAADGFNIEGAEASCADAAVTKRVDEDDKVIEGQWVLNIPNMDSVAPTDSVTISNVRDAETHFDVTKELVNLKGGTYQLKKNDFTFTLAGVADEAGVMPPMPSVTQVKNGNTKDADGKDIVDLAVFGDITYTKAGTYTYTISEERGSIPGVKYEGVDYPITATVVVSLVDPENPASGFKAETTYTQDGEAITERVFTNNYEPDPVSMDIPVAKDFTKTNVRPEKKTFTFLMNALEATVPSAEGTVYSPLPTKATTIDANKHQATVSVEDAATGKFGDIAFDAVGTYKYTVEEMDLVPAKDYIGYAKDDTVYEVTAVVTDNSTTGKLEVDWSVDPDPYNKELVFTNDYKPIPVSVKLPVMKKFDSSSNPRPDKDVDPKWDSKEFTFNLYKAPKTDTSEPIDTIKAVENVRAEFEAIEFNAAGTYTYVVSEDNSFEDPESENYLEGYHQSTDYQNKTYQVVVTDNNGILNAAIYLEGNLVEVVTTIMRGDKEIVLPEDATLDELATRVVSPKEGVEAVFLNNYIPGVAEIQIPVKKEFTETSNPRATNEDGSIKYAKTFTFELTSVDKDKDPLLVKGEDDNPVPAPGGKLITDVADAGSSAFPAMYWTAAGTYQYKVVEWDSLTMGHDPNPADSGYTNDKTEYIVTITVKDVDGKLVVSDYAMSGTNGKKGSLSAADIPASEEYPNGRMVQHEGPGLLTADIVDSDELTLVVTFTNEYIPAPTTFKIPVQKVIDCDVTPTDFKKTFEFVLEPVDGAPLPEDVEKMEVTIVDQGTAEFDLGEGIFTEAGTYTYTVTETSYEGDKNYHGYIFDQETATVTIEVVDVDGKLVVSSYKVEKGGSSFTLEASAEQLAQYGDGLVYDKLTDEKTAITIVFTNSYTPDATELVIPVEKLFTDDSNVRPEDFTKEFTFELAGVSADVPGFPEFEVPMPAEGTEEVTIPEGVVGQFGSIEFIHAGVYKYTVSEKEPINAETLFHGYTFDKTVYDVTITVTDHDGVLAAAWNIKPKSEGMLDAIQNLFGAGDENTGDQWVDGKKDAEQAPEPITFTNSYAPDKTEIVLEAVKILNGKALTDGEFAFELSEDGKVIGQTKNTADGKVVFEAIEYTEVGKHVYTITEKAGSDATITYDSTTYTAEVEVVDVDGKLAATCEYSAKPVFTNTYTPPTTPPERTAKTGDGLGGMFPLAALVAAAAGAVAVFAGRRGRKEQRGAHVRH